MSLAHHKRRLFVAAAVLFLLVRRERTQIFYAIAADGSKGRPPRDDATVTSETRQRFAKRRGGFLTTHTACRISKWLYSQERGTLSLYRECKAELPDRQLRNVAQLEEHDTLFVPFTAMEQFVNELLGQLSCNVVIISGQTHLVPTVADATIQELLDHEHVTRWFAQNLPVYGGADPRHPKISPFPYGLKETDGNGATIFEAYQRVFFDTVGENATRKTTDIYAGPLGRTHPGRRRVPQSSQHHRFLPPERFFRNVADARYVLSPNGDRPDCHRHYEAIGLGAVPITELDPVLFRHLAEGPAVYETKDWKLSSLRATLGRNPLLGKNPLVNRDLIREDYWTDWAEKEVGTKLNWRQFAKATENEEVERS